MKPRISLRGGLTAYGVPSQWWCEGLGGYGVGSTPSSAYESWRQYLAGMRNAYPMQNSAPPPSDQRSWLERWFGC